MCILYTYNTIIVCIIIIISICLFVAHIIMIIVIIIFRSALGDFVTRLHSRTIRPRAEAQQSDMSS